ncbi:unnamed protein product [[Candida] boidinii]|uniref:Unnamed protein product n=1 Tax=Candida boidinii TaxID=5477 RepID=A0A9W6SY89_CANBO|nr:hypothetical protein B5S30_g80 [[Candida] boidinii]OWB82066.1 hypothetical protein B5S33_g687 [[Candida] boidinii]GME69709.1 unnamed protein product [[Candida] boidinii]
MPPKRGSKKSATTSSPAKETKRSTRSAKGKAVAAEVPAPKQESVEESSDKKTFNIKESNIKNAISELIDFGKREKEASGNSKSQLFDDEEIENKDLYLQITNLKFFNQKQQFKHKFINVKNSIYDSEKDFKICLFTKDDSISEEILNELEEKSIPHLSKIISAKELKGEYRPYEARRKLESEYDLFLSDDSLITSLPKLLGKIFYNSPTKIPISIKTQSSDKKFSIKTTTNQINKILNQIAFIPPMGVNVSIKVGNLENKLSNLLENIESVYTYFEAQNLPIRSISLKLRQSPSLPIYINKELYSEEDVVKEDENDKKTKTTTENGVKLTKFEKALLELAVNEQQVEQVLGKKAKQQKKEQEKENSPKKRKSESISNGAAKKTQKKRKN